MGGWIGVDLDGTLAGWGDPYPTDVLKVGPPIARMVEQVKEWLAKGQEVRIFTARVGPCTDDEALGALVACATFNPRLHNPKAFFIDYQRKLIERWCVEHLGQALPVTATKDFHMWVLYDDRAEQVVSNLGVLVREALLALPEGQV